MKPSFCQGKEVKIMLSLSDSALFLTDSTFHKQKSNDCDNDSDDELDLVEWNFMQFDSSHVREQLVAFFFGQDIWQEFYRSFLPPWRQASAH